MVLVQIQRKAGSYQEGRSALLDESYAKAWSALRPMFAHVYVENRCHLSCAHCYETEDTHPHGDQLSLAEYERAFESLARMGVLVLTFSGGEVFLRRDLFDIIELARKKRFAVRLYTSGTLIDEQRADRIKQLQVSEVHVSLYSHDASVHDAFTGVPRSHERSVRAMKLLRERGVHTVLKANVMTFNVDYLDEIIALAKSVDADWQFDPTVKPRMNGDTRPLEYAVPPETLKARVLMRADLQSRLSLEQAQGICDGHNLRDGGASMCAAARGVVSLGADGGIYPCAMYPTPVANVKSDDLQTVWARSRVFNEMREQSMATMTDCPSCGVRGACTPCMAYALVEHGDHRACNSSSRQLATATHLMAKDATRADEKARRGRPLQIAGDPSIPDDAQSRRVPALSTEL